MDKSPISLKKRKRAEESPCFLITENFITKNDDEVAADIEEQSSDDEANEVLRPKISRAELTMFLDEMKRFATTNHQNLLQNLRTTEVSFYDTLFESEQSCLNSYFN